MNPILGSVITAFDECYAVCVDNTLYYPDVNFDEGTVRITDDYNEEIFEVTPDNFISFSYHVSSRILELKEPRNKSGKASFGINFLKCYNPGVLEGR